MDDFTRLMKGIIYEHNVKVDDAINEDFYYIGGELTWPCRVCDDMHPLNCEPEEFDKSYHYCGKSPACCL